MAGRFNESSSAEQAPAAPVPAAGEPAPQTHARALSELFEHHNQTLVSFLMGRLGNEAEAKEVAQEAYVRMLQLDQPGAVSFLRAYLFKTAANIAMDRVRHRLCAERLDPVYQDEELTNTVDPEREVSAREELAIVRQALMELPARYRRAFLLKRFDDLSTDAVGKALGIQEAQARKYLRRVAAYCRLRLDGLTETEAKERVFS